MQTSRTFSLALGAAALVATSVVAWHRTATDHRDPDVRTDTFQAVDAGAMYLPDLFVDAERTAPIEPLPPQF